LSHRRIAIAAGLLTETAAVLLVRPAAAMDEFVVYGTRPKMAVELDREALRVDLERDVLALHASLRTALAEQAKARRASPAIEVASVASQPRG
jgi:hypothetical protein